MCRPTKAVPPMIRILMPRSCQIARRGGPGR
jgi:hypothetical protein